MTVRPHDISDLYLAPVVLAVDARIQELGQLTAPELAYQIALQGDHAELTARLREAGLLQTIRYTVDMHDWELSLDQRGLRLTHGQHSLVLGIPETFTDYLSAKTIPSPTIPA